MNPETRSNLAKKLVRLAYADPEKRAQILPLLDKLASDKVAVSKETTEFQRWVMNTQAPMTPREVETFISRTLRIPTSSPRVRRGGPRFLPGDEVIIVARKHMNGRYDSTPYKRFDKKVGTVTATDDPDVLVAFKGEPAPVRFPGAQSSQGVGIYKYTPAYEVKGSAKIEMVYFAGNKPTKDQKIVVEVYLSKAKKVEKRSSNYYTGHVVLASIGKKGYYFMGFPQQRMQMDPSSEGGYGARAFNPRIGDVYYIGVIGHRPPGWDEELAKIDEQFKAATGAEPKVGDDEDVPDEPLTDAEFEKALDVKFQG